MTTEAVTAEELRETIARQFGRSLHIRTLDTGLLPVHVWIPGYPPSPLALLHGLGVAVGRLAERVRDRSFTAPGYPERADGDSSHRWISRRGVTGYRYRIPATGHLRPALHGHPERRSGIACEVIVRLIPDCWLEHLTEPP